MASVQYDLVLEGEFELCRKIVEGFLFLLYMDEQAWMRRVQRSP